MASWETKLGSQIIFWESKLGSHGKPSWETKLGTQTGNPNKMERPPTNPATWKQNWEPWEAMPCWEAKLRCNNFLYGAANSSQTLVGNAGESWQAKLDTRNKFLDLSLRDSIAGGQARKLLVAKLGNVAEGQQKTTGVPPTFNYWRPNWETELALGWYMLHRPLQRRGKKHNQNVFGFNCMSSLLEIGQRKV